MRSTIETGMGSTETLDGMRSKEAGAAAYEVLHEILERQVDTHPEAVAVVFGREQVTYAELEDRANRLTYHLLRRGVSRGSVVGMVLPRSTDVYAAILGILKAGAAYTPIDPEYPDDRIAFILEDSGAVAVVTSQDLAKHCPAFRGAVVRMDADRTAIEWPGRPTDGIPYRPWNRAFRHKTYAPRVHEDQGDMFPSRP